MRYRRSDQAGGMFFFTVNLADRSSSLLTENIEILRQVMRKVKDDHPFDVVAMVVLPEHLHAIWMLPAGDNDFAMRWSLIKSGFSRNLLKTEPIHPGRIIKRERGIWQRRYWEHQIRDDMDLQRHVDYIHINPVKHGYVKQPVQWPYSSVHRYIRDGLISANWSVDVAKEDVSHGE